MIQLKNVSKFYYSKGMIASGISKVNLELGIGEFVVITGESGSGKTTLLNVISGLDSYEEGEMYIDGKETSHYLASDFEDYRKKYIGNIFQSFNLVNSYTVYQNIELILRINGYKRTEMKKRITDIIKKVGLEAYTRTKVSKLSGGQKQRVAIARALAKDTDIIVADEPTGNLDSVSAQGIAQLLSEISRDKLVIVVTHNYEQFAPYATRKIKMHDGKVAEDNLTERGTYVKAMNMMPTDSIAQNDDLRWQEEGIRQMGVTGQQAAAPGDDTQEAAAESVSTGKISVGSKLRLGIRNTFNIFYKFILLLIVFVFVVTAVTAQYTTFKKQDEEASKMGYNDFFSNYSEDRIVLKKSDGSQFTDDDFNIIDSTYNIKSVDPGDVLLDNYIYIENEDISYEAFPKTIDEFKGKLIAGRMPSKENEVILMGAEDDYYFSEDMLDSVLDKTYTILIGEDSEFKVTVVGMGYKKTEDNEYIYTGDIFIGDELMAKMMKEIYSYRSKVTTDINGKLQVYEGMGSYYRMIPNSHVDKGEALLSEEANNFYEKWDAKGKTIKITAENIYYTESVSLEISDLYTDKNFSDKTGLSDYDYYMGAVFVNSADFNKLFAKGNYQVSVYVNDVREIDKTESALETMGYVTLPLKDVLTTYDDGITAIIQVPMAIIVVLALFFIAYFVIRLILRSRLGYFSILRMLGLSKRNIRRLLDIEMFAVVNIAYAIFLGLIGLVRYHVIKVEYIWTLVEYISVGDFAVLYAVIVLMAYLISGKFVRSIFRKSAMGSFREEG